LKTVVPPPEPALIAFIKLPPTFAVFPLIDKFAFPPIVQLPAIDKLLDNQIKNFIK
jgi:hypothetical protein